MKHEAITKQIIGCAMRVHSTLGNGFQEVIYQRALAIEMQEEGLNFEREKEMNIYYHGQMIGTSFMNKFRNNGLRNEEFINIVSS